MAFLVAHAEKYSIGACAGLGIHVDRKSEEHSNKNIDNTLSSENVELVENYNNNLYGAVKDRIREGYTGEKAKKFNKGRIIKTWKEKEEEIKGWKTRGRGGIER